MKIDLNSVPFSSFGSYFTFSHVDDNKKVQKDLYLKTVHGGLQNRILFTVELTSDEKPVSFIEKASPGLLRLETENGFVEICICGPKLIRIHGMGTGFCLKMDEPGFFDNALPNINGVWEVNSYASRLKLALVPLKGKLVMDAPWEEVRCKYINANFVPCDSTSEIEFVIEEFATVWSEKNYNETFDECRIKVEDSINDWTAKSLQVPDEFLETRQLAAYINWASVVEPSGNMKRNSMYMSKNWMINVYSWDHCFTAMALAKNDPQLAWDQLMVLFDHQDENGALPDHVNDKVVVWNFCKPPIHGWTLKWMMEKYGFTDKTYLEKIYKPLCRWTEWWFTYRDYDGDGIPQYNHGNDSGWDNATCYHAGAPLEAPDLAAYLVIQMEVLSEIALILGKSDEAGHWKIRADKLLGNLISHSWTENGFIAPISGTHKVFDSDSLYVYLPIILGKRLPEHIRSFLISGLKEKGRFLTDYGFATESIRSRYYETDGYWRGPIWAPSTMIIVDGLWNAGEKEFAREIAYKFCSMCKKSGMAENFNALTGEALRDHAYTWTSSVFLILANEFLL